MNLQFGNPIKTASTCEDRVVFIRRLELLLSPA